MALSGWNPDKKITISIPAQSGELIDFPLLLNLSTGSGLTNYDCTQVFTELGSNKYKLAVEYGDTGQQCFIEIERWDAASNNAQLWVKVPTVSSTVDTIIHLYYDSSHADNTACVSDTSWSSVVLAMPMDGAEGATTFTDLKGKTVTTTGNVKITAAQSKFGGGSAFFDGNGDYLTVPDSADFAFGSGDFTAECWFSLAANPTAYAGDYGVCLMMQGQATASTRSFMLFIGGSSAANCSIQGEVYSGSTAYSATATGVNLALNTMHHLELDRVGSSLLLFLNGTQIGSASVGSITINDASQPLWIGAFNDATYRYYLNGYIDDLRITKGVARHSANFTPPTRSVFEDSSGYVGDIGSYPAKQVWNPNYPAVYHFSQDPSITVKDSTANVRHLTPYGTMTTAQLEAGPTGKALALDGVDDYLASANGNLGALQTAFTAEVVAKFTPTSASARLLTVGAEATGQIMLNRSASTDYLIAGVWGDETDSGVALDHSNFKHYGQLFSGGVIKAIGNGSIDSVSNAITVQDLTSDPITIAKTGTTYYQQTVRSIRVSKIARSAAWLAASYNADFDQLVTFGNLVTGVVDVPLDSVSGTAVVTAVCVGDFEALLPSVASEAVSTFALGTLGSNPYIFEGYGDSVLPAREGIGEFYQSDLLDASGTSTFAVCRFLPQTVVFGDASTAIHCWGRTIPKRERISATGVGYTYNSTIIQEGVVVSGVADTSIYGFGAVGRKRVVVDGDIAVTTISVGNVSFFTDGITISGSAASAIFGGVTFTPVKDEISGSAYMSIVCSGRYSPVADLISARSIVSSHTAVLGFSRSPGLSGSTEAPELSEILHFTRS